MPSFSLSLQLAQDGVALPSYPVARRLVATKTRAFTLVLASAGNTTTWTQLPLSDFSTVTFLELHTDQAITLRTTTAADASSLGSTPINAGGSHMLWDVSVPVVSGVGLRVNNNSGVTATVTGTAGGS